MLEEPRAENMSEMDEEGRSWEFYKTLCSIIISI